ncbi:MAG: hypothetical protein M0035_12975 [Actinomycetota bacterium]|nr:hypothetical protein [Actinomycetota bacterium]
MRKHPVHSALSAHQGYAVPWWQVRAMASVLPRHVFSVASVPGLRLSAAGILGL